MKNTTILAISITALIIVVVALWLYKVSPGVEQLKLLDSGYSEINARNPTNNPKVSAYLPSIAEMVAMQRKLGYDDARIANNLNVSVNDLKNYLL